MPSQYTVPQFIEVEDRILGPLSVRQFVIMLVGGLTIVALYKLLTFIPFVLAALLVLGLTAVFTFAKVNGMPFHFFVLNIIQSLRKPKLRVWDKTLSLAEIKRYMTALPALPPPPPPKKTLLSGSRLQELTLLVNTGGAYHPEE